MGNAINVTLKEDRQLEITEQLVRGFQEQVSLVDTSMSGLVKTLDSLKVSCEMFLRQVDSKVNSSADSQEKDDQDQKEDVAELAVRLLKTIHDSVLDQKKTAMESLTQLLHSVINTGRSFVNVSDEDITLSLDEYMAELNKDDTMIGTRPYYETRVDLLRNELKLSKKLNTIQTEQIAVLNNKNETFYKEIEVLRRRNQDLEDEKKDLVAKTVKTEEENRRLEIRFKEMVEEKEKIEKTFSTKSTGLEKDPYQDRAYTNEESIQVREVEKYHSYDVERSISNDSKTELERLRRELENETLMKKSLESELKTIKSKECIHVQIINKTSAVTPISDVISACKSEVETQSSQLYITEHKYEKKDLEKLKAQVPLMVFVNTNRGLQDSALKALDDISGVKSVALVVVHRMNSDTSITASNQVLLNVKFKRLAGIFDLVYNFNNGFYQCNMNDRNINGIVSFIRQNGKRTSVLEAYGLI